MITPVCECFGVLPEHQGALHTQESAKQLLDSWLLAFQVRVYRSLQLSQPLVFRQLGGLRCNDVIFVSWKCVLWVV